MLAHIAAHAIRLARLELLYRVGFLDPKLERAAAREDVDDLLAMLSIVPFDRLAHGTPLLLNRDFGDASELVGGADVDLISGDVLVEFKATTRGSLTTQDLDEILGYYLLARRARSSDPEFPRIERLGFYLCRHGVLWTLHTRAWTRNPQFGKVEQWFFRRARELSSLQDIVRRWRRPPAGP